MNRRQFIQRAAGSFLVPGGLLLAGPGLPAWAAGPSGRIFYDERFPEARRLAAGLPGFARLTPVQGDVTEWWQRELRAAFAAAPQVVRGVTTESFYFCLRNMARTLTRLDSEAIRIGRDLREWTIRSHHDQQGLTGI
jgi:hypothetical protein